MDVIDRAEREPEPISIARCRELLGDDADMMSDEEILTVARHAETLAHVLIAVALQDVRPTTGQAERRTDAGQDRPSRRGRR